MIRSRQMSRSRFHASFFRHCNIAQSMLPLNSFLVSMRLPVGYLQHRNNHEHKRTDKTKGHKRKRTWMIAPLGPWQNRQRRRTVSRPEERKNGGSKQVGFPRSGLVNDTGV